MIKITLIAEFRFKNKKADIVSISKKGIKKCKN